MTTYSTCTGSIRTDSSGSWWHCDTGFVERSESEVVALLTANGAIEQTTTTPEINVTVSPLPPLTAEQGQELGIGFLLVMSIAFCFKQLRVLKP